MTDSIHRRSERKATYLFAAIMVVAIALGTWLYIMDLPPRKPVYNPRMPRPNAYYIYLEARKKIVNTGRLEWALRPPSPMPAGPGPGPLPPGAAPVSTQAPTPSPESPAPIVATAADKEAVLAENAEALKKMREGFNHDCQIPPPKNLAELTEYSGANTLATLRKLLILEIEVREQQGDWQSAMNSRLDMLRLAAEMSRGGYAGNACYAKKAVYKGAWATIEKLSAANARSAAPGTYFRAAGIIRRYSECSEI